MSCLSDIVTLGICPDEAASLSGFQLLQAPGISLKTLAQTANENYNSGIEMAMDKKEIALIQVRSDFVGALQSNKVVTTISHPVYSVANFNPAVNKGSYSGERGLWLHKAPFSGSLRTTYIQSVQIYPLASGDVTLKFYYELNGEVVSSGWEISLVANQLNTFDSTQLEGFPFAIPAYASNVKILFDQSSIPVASSAITCLKGCNGSMPNDCGWAEGWDGIRKIQQEGYGVNVTFNCKCDYEKILCDLAPSFSGELIWIKWQIAIMEEQYRTNRFSDLVIYGRDELGSKIIPELRNDYIQKWNQLMNGLFAILKTYRDGCLDCRKTRWVTNI